MHSMVTSAGEKALTTFVVVSAGSRSQEHGRYGLSNCLTAVKMRSLSSAKLLSRIAPFDVIKGLFLLNIDQPSSVYGI